MKSLIEIVENVKKVVLNQDDAIETLAVSLYKNLLISEEQRKDRYYNLKPSPVMLIGHTGSGKTFLCSELSKEMGVNFIEINSKSICQEGWEGNSLLKLIEQRIKNIKIIQEKIIDVVVLLDEFDKLCLSNASSRDNNISIHLQSSLLKYLEGYEIFPKTRFHFILAGAFSGIEKKEILIGFNKNSENIELTKSLEKYGLLPELIGRLINIIQLNDISTDMFYHLLSNDNFMYKQWKGLLDYYDLNVFISPYDQIEIVKKAENLHLGVRGLQKEVDNSINLQIKKQLFKLGLKK